jgi:hypothetical protein
LYKAWVGSVRRGKGQEVVARYCGISEAAPQPIIVRRVGVGREERREGGSVVERVFR